VSLGADHPGTKSEADNFRCAVCGHLCNPVDGGGWICDKRGGCGSEWPEEE